MNITLMDCALKTIRFQTETNQMQSLQPFDTKEEVGRSSPITPDICTEISFLPSFLSATIPAHRLGKR